MHRMKETKNNQHQHRAAPGQVLVIFAIALIALLGFAALAVDVGYYLAERRSVQNATDAAAMAAARLVLRNNTDNLVGQAQSYIAANGYSDASVVVYWDDEEVRVEVEHEVERFFLGAVYDGDWSVSTEAVARVAPADVPFAIIALGEDPNCVNPPGFHFSGTASELGTIGGGIGTNACVNFDGHPHLDIDGNIEAHGSIDLSNNMNSSGPVMEEQGIIPDPHAAFAGANDPMTICESNPEPEVEESGSGGQATYTMEPGWYQESLRFGAQHRVTMEPGIYCFDNELAFSGQASLDATSGVLLYFRGPNGTLELAQGDFAVHTLGQEWNDFAIWSDNCSMALDMRGRGTLDIVGQIYVPCSTLHLGGTPANQVINGQLVAHNLRFHGNPNFQISVDLETPSEALRVFLVE
jgi:hypothetical protein